VEANPHSSQDLARLVARYARPQRQTCDSGTVGYREENNLEQSAQCAQLVGVHASAQKAQLLGRGEVEVRAFAGRQEVAIVGQDGGNTWLLLGEVPMNNGAAERRLDQVPNPLRWPKHEPRSGWRVATGLSRVGVEQRAIPAIVSDRQGN
jgi:hypothetical protein